MKQAMLLTLIIGLLFSLSSGSLAQARVGENRPGQSPPAPTPPVPTGSNEINDLNQALAKRAASRTPGSDSPSDYVIGANDLVAIEVFDIKDLDRVVRVSNQGRITLPLIGSVQASGLTAHELEVVIAELLRQKYVKNPQVSVFIKEFQSRPVAIYGAVKKPGIVQLQSPKTLIEMLAMAEGFSEDAGDYVTVRRHGFSTRMAAVPPDGVSDERGNAAGNGSLPGTGSTSKTPQPPPGQTSRPPLEVNGAAAGTSMPQRPVTDSPDTANSSEQSSESPVSKEQVDIIKIKITDLIGSSDPKYNLMIEPGDAINVAKAGVVYVIGDVGRPGGFVLKERESLTVLQAVSLAEGVHGTALKSATRIIRKHPDGTKEEIPIDLGKVFEGKQPDVALQNNDVLFIPVSAGKSAFRRTADAALQIATGVAIYRR